MVAIESAAFTADDEAWHSKDAFQLACELLAMSELGGLQNEVVGMIIGYVTTFGLDGIAIVAFFVALRAKYSLGRGGDSPDETEWLAGATMMCVTRANEYLISEHVGDANLLDLARDLLT